MQAYSQLLPPTAVTHALNLPFLNPQAQNLIVVKTTLLQIFEVAQVPALGSSVENSSRGGQPETQRVHDGNPSNTVPQSRLILVAEYDLAGVVTSLARIKALNTRTGGEALLISFRDAKISLVEWDPTTYSISTISIHFYENENLQGSPLSPDLNQCSTFLIADPSSRAAALKFGENQLAVIPFRQVGDDLAGGDFDSDLDEKSPRATSTSNQNGDLSETETPYGSSFVLPLSTLDPNVITPVDLAFLYEYREPTLGVLSSSEDPSASLAQERRDIITYTAFTLDLEQRARTILLSVPDLPSDLFKLQPLPIPIGGALLIGGNEVIHVDQSGRTHGVAVNEFARQASSFPMTDQSNLDLALDGSVATQVNGRNRDMFLFLRTGEIVSISFHVEGRSVSGLFLRRMADGAAGKLVHTPASCTASLDKDLIFVGSERADSLLIRFTSQRSQLSRKRSHADALGGEDAMSDDGADDDDDDEDDDDDLYAEGTKASNGVFSQNTDTSSAEYTFIIDDCLQNLTAVGEPCFAKVENPANGPHSDDREDAADEKIQIVFPSGHDTIGGLTILNQQIHLSNAKDLPLFDLKQTWSLRVSKPGATAANGTMGSTSQGIHRDQFLVTAGTFSGNPVSKLYTLSSGGIEEVKDSYFDNDSYTINAGVLGNGNRIVQISENEIRCLDGDLALTQMIPMLDEVTEAELGILQTSFADPYLLVVRDDSSIVVFKMDDRCDQLEPIDRGKAMMEQKWSSGSLYQSKHDAASDPLAFFLSSEGTLSIYQLPDLEQPIFVVEAVNLVPPFLTTENFFRRAPNREHIVEILVADLGAHSLCHPHLILRTADDNLAIYRAYHTSTEQNSSKFTDNLRWLKVYDSSLLRAYGFGAESTQQSLSAQLLTVIPNLDGYSTVFVRSERPKLILSEPTSMPKVIEIAGKPLDLSPINTLECTNGLVHVRRNGKAILSHLPTSTRFGDTGWAARRVKLGTRVESLCFHAPTGLYILGTNEPIPFALPDNDDWHSEWATENISIRPEGNLAKIKLFDPATCSVIHEVDLEPDEVVTVVKDALLEISEITYEQKILIAVGTAIVKGEDLAANGNIYIYDIIRVVPEPEKPETDRALKQIAKEEVKGAVTELSEIGSDGFLFSAQGQKCMVRGLKEDNTLLPVAFLDVQCTVTALKNVKGTGMALIGDVFKGLCLAGFSTDPYRIRLFGKSKMSMEVVTADFLPEAKQLFVIVADTNRDLHILEFNPEDPKSLSGQRLLHRNVFHTGHFPAAMVSIPTSLRPADLNLEDEDTAMEDTEETTPVYNTLLMSRSGALAIITPVDEQTYRRLSALQIHLTGFLEHPCGLNPRVFRAIESEASGGRGVLDGQVLKRWYSLSSQRKAEASTRVGSDVWQVKSDLERIAGAGMDYF